MAEQSFFRRKIVAPVIGFLRQGVSPSQLAMAISIGIVIATVPVFGASTLLCAVAIWMFRLNPAAVLFINQIAYPLQFICYIPLIRAGEWIFRAPHIPLSIPQLFALFKDDLWGAIGKLWWSTLYALAVWMVLAIAVSWVLHRIFFGVFQRTRNSLGIGN